MFPPLFLDCLLKHCSPCYLCTAQIFIPTAEPVMPIRIPSKDLKAEIETHQVTAEVKINKVQ